MVRGPSSNGISKIGLKSDPGLLAVSVAKIHGPRRPHAILCIFASISGFAVWVLGVVRGPRSNGISKSGSKIDPGPFAVCRGSRYCSLF